MAKKKTKKEKVMPCQAHAKEQDEIEKNQFLGYCIVPEGKLGILKNFRLEYDNRDILFQQIEDGSIGIHITRPDRGEADVPQQLRLSELTLTLLVLGILKSSEEFGIDFNNITDSINQILHTNYEKAR